jgi:uncharacterized protein YcbK (DUF882 family)
MYSRLSQHFNSNEFKCHCGACELVKPPQELLDVLEDVREHFGKPVTVMSGHRCYAHNLSVGGATKSKHLLGIASDIKVKDISPNKVQEYVLNKYKDSYGIGKYAYFTHIDVRSYKSRW